MDHRDVIVLGAGISGLTAAFWLHRAGFSTLALEASDHPGGCITTWKQDGFLFEMGPNTVLNNAFEIDALCEAAGILKSRLTAFPSSKKRFIAKGGRLVPLPGGPAGFLATPLFSMKTKLGLLKEPFIKPAPADQEETIARFVRRRLGEEMLQYAVGPFVSGVYAGDPEKLSVRHAVSKIYALEEKYGSLIKGAVAKRKGPAPAGGLFSFPEGLEALPKTLAAALGDGYRQRTRVLSVERADGAYAVEAEDSYGAALSFRARSVICALSSEAAGAALSPLGGEFPRAIPAIPYADVALVCLGFKRGDVDHPLDGFGFLAPEVEGRFVLGCLFPSALFPGRAPEGHVALAAFAGGAIHPERAAHDGPALVQRVIEDLRPLLGLKGEPVLTHAKAWRPAIPQYVVGHGALKEAAAKMEAANPGLFVSGNLLYGVSVGNCIQNATSVAERAKSFLRTLPTMPLGR